MGSLSVTETIPEYLQPYIAQQDASLYTPMDHAAWRFIMKIAQGFFARHAHQMYLDGLEKTGISTDRIPLISEMDQKLRHFGWRAVPISGFIPPAAFMEFLSLGLLPIACDMRKLENLAYTPEPDIVHEAAGHAPIIADPDYARYLRRYGEISRKAISSSQDWNVYVAIRDLSATKADPRATPEEIARAQAELEAAIAAVDFVSEATELARMSWWTIEYGLIGSFENPKIYGAGLLSSIGESYHCLGDGVKKLPLTLDCVKVGYDITRPQPQLFVAESFEALTEVLEALANTMAFRRGGRLGLERALRARTTTTTVLDSGLQISGILDVLQNSPADPDGSSTPAYLRYRGPCQLAFEDRQLPGHGPRTHAEGFGLPLGPLCDGSSPTELTLEGVRRLGGQVEFASGVRLEGRVESLERRNGQTLLIRFRDCRVTGPSGEVLYRPEWGPYDLGCGTRVVSVFGDAADRGRYHEVTGGFGQAPRQPKTNLTEGNRRLNELYAEVRALREAARGAGDSGGFRAALEEGLAEVHAALEAGYPEDWLLRYELLELAREHALSGAWVALVREQLLAIGARSGEKRELLARGGVLGAA